jgi:hypothetical protein
MVMTQVQLGPFLVQENGQLALRQPGSEPGFTFMWRGRRFAVRIRQTGMSLSVPVGRLPSTSAGAGRREAATELLRALARHLPSGWGMRLLPDHRIQIDSDQVMDLPATIGGLLTPVVGLLLRVAPVLDLVDECGLAK